MTVVSVCCVAAGGSPSTIKGRTFSCSFELPLREVERDPPKLYPNPMVLAQTWQRQLDSGAVESRAALARKLGVSRAHVTQVLRLLTLAPQVKETVLALGDPIQGRIVGAHALRPLCKLSAKEQRQWSREILNQRDDRLLQATKSLAGP